MISSQYSYSTEPVWDGATRIWHWLLALSVTAGWLLGEFRTFSVMQWHLYFGYCTASLLVFRVYLGCFGPKTVRISSLLPTVSVLLTYMKTLSTREPSGIRGHSPLGGIASMAFLILLVVQVTTGLFSVEDDLFFEGPLAWLVPSAYSENPTHAHHIGARAILVMFILHIGAMLFYGFWKKENLVTAMIKGKKLVKSTSENTDSS